jgi:hypothetical protein
MADLRGFDANQVEPSTDFDPIPAGKYLAIITESEMRPNKAGTGHFLQLTFQIMEGPFKNRLLWARLNLDNPNATAVQIARAELSAICRAGGPERFGVWTYLRFSSSFTLRSSSSTLRRPAFSSAYCVNDSVIEPSRRNFTGTVSVSWLTICFGWPFFVVP